MPVLQSDRPATPAASSEVKRILTISVPVIVKLAERRMSMADVMRLGVGAIIEFAKRSEEPLQLLVNNKAIAVGEAVKVGENFGLRVTQIGDIKQVIRTLGAGTSG